MASSSPSRGTGRPPDAAVAKARSMTARWAYAAMTLQRRGRDSEYLHHELGIDMDRSAVYRAASNLRWPTADATPVFRPWQAIEVRALGLRMAWVRLNVDRDPWRTTGSEELSDDQQERVAAEVVRHLCRQQPAWVYAVGVEEFGKSVVALLALAGEPRDEVRLARAWLTEIGLPFFFAVLETFDPLPLVELCQQRARQAAHREGLLRSATDPASAGAPPTATGTPGARP